MPDPFTQPHFERAALVTIDTQCDTLDGQPLEVPGTSAVLPAMRQLTAAFRRRARPIVHVVRIYRRDGSNVDLCRRAAVQSGASLLLEGSAGAQLAPALFEHAPPALRFEELLRGELQEVGHNETILYKPRWGAFYQTRLEDYLRAQDVDTVVLAGCNFPNCPRTTLYEASERDFRTVLVEDALSGLYDRGRSELQNIGVHVMRTTEVVARLAGLGDARGPEIR
jgi:nicotinamidase-related amidase